MNDVLKSEILCHLETRLDHLATVSNSSLVSMFQSIKKNHIFARLDKKDIVTTRVVLTFQKCSQFLKFGPPHFVPTKKSTKVANLRVTHAHNLGNATKRGFRSLCI